MIFDPILLRSEQNEEAEIFFTDFVELEKFYRENDGKIEAVNVKQSMDWYLKKEAYLSKNPKKSLLDYTSHLIEYSGRRIWTNKGEFWLQCDRKAMLKMAEIAIAHKYVYAEIPKLLITMDVLPDRLRGHFNVQNTSKDVKYKTPNEVLTLRHGWDEKAGVPVPNKIAKDIYILAHQDNIEKTIARVKKLATAKYVPYAKGGFNFFESIAFQYLGDEKFKLSEDHDILETTCLWINRNTGTIITTNREVYGRFKILFSAKSYEEVSNYKGAPTKRLPRGGSAIKRPLL